MDESKNGGNFISAEITGATAKEEKGAVKSVHKKKYNTKGKKKKNKNSAKPQKSRKEIKAEEIIVDEKTKELMALGLQSVVTRKKRAPQKKKADNSDIADKKDNELLQEAKELTDTDIKPSEQAEAPTEAKAEVPTEAPIAEEIGDTPKSNEGDINTDGEDAHEESHLQNNGVKTEVISESDDFTPQNVDENGLESYSEEDDDYTEREIQGEDEQIITETESQDAITSALNTAPHIDSDGLNHYSMLDDDGEYLVADELAKKEAVPVIPEKSGASKEKDTAEKERKIDGRFDFVELFVFTLCAVLLLTTFVFRHSIVEGSSMINTLHDGDHLIISDLFYTPDYGDIVVVEDYTTGLRAPIVKRVIALGGDTVTVKNNYSSNTVTVIVNGETLYEEYVCIDGDLPLYNNEQIQFVENYVVPEGEIYVMGDHRNNSTDSRYFGAVSEQAVLGRVLVRFYPFDDFMWVD